MRDLTNGFLVVKRFERVYAAFAEKPEFDKAIYALPLCGTGHERLTVRYRGLDREAISPAAKGSLAEVRLRELDLELSCVDALGLREEDPPAEELELRLELLVRASKLVTLRRHRGECRARLEERLRRRRQLARRRG